MALTLEDHLRLLLGERIPPLGTDADTFFTDAQIIELLDTYGDLNLACSAGWSAKAAEFSKYIDIDESGSTRKLSQMYRQARLQADHFAKMAEEGGQTRADGLRSGIVARSSQIMIPPDQVPFYDRVHNSSGERGNRA